MHLRQEKPIYWMVKQRGVIFCLSVIVMLVSLVEISHSQDANVAKRKQAEAIHERIRIHFKNQNYPQVAAEMNDLFRLKLEGPDEDLVARELIAVVSNLIRVKQYAIAHQITDASLNYFTKPNTRATAWIQKGKIFEAEGKSENALTAFKRAEEEAKRR